MLFSRKPYIVKSRSNQTLLQRLLEDDYPILFEGLHTAAIIDSPELKDRFKLLRTHNVEHDYYRGLAQKTESLPKRMYYAWEAKKLKRFEKVVEAANTVLAISQDDFKHFSQRNNRVELVFPFHAEPAPVFLENPKPAEAEMKEAYCLYQGNLEVEENKEAARFIIEKISPQISQATVIAGKGAAEFGEKFASEKIHFIDKPNDSQLLKLSQNASVHLLPTFQATGFKLKLLYALSTGRHVLVNKAMIAGTDVGQFCHQAESAGEWVAKVAELANKSFAESEFNARQEFLQHKYSNEKLAGIILAALPDSTR